MKKTGKIITGLMLAGAMTVLTACNNGGGGSPAANSAYSAAASTPGYLNTGGGRGYVVPGQYIGVISLAVSSVNTPQYGYLMSMLNMNTVSQNFQVTITTNGQVPGNAQFIIQPMRQSYGYYNQVGYGGGQIPGLNDTAETASNGLNGMILTYYQPENSQPCTGGVNCGRNLPDIQMVASVATTQTAANNPASCGGGFGFRPSMTVQLRVAGTILGSGVLCGTGNAYGGNPWNRGGYPYQQSQWVYR